MWLNKLVWFVLNPMMLGMLMLGFGIVLQIACRNSLATAFCLMALLWFWAWSTPVSFEWLGGGLEKKYPPLRAETMPKADAIVLLGGGMGSNTNMPYAEMWTSADRVWHAARLYKAGRAPIIITSGVGEAHASVPLLLDLGVPRKAIHVENESRNTAENAAFSKKLLRTLVAKERKKPRVLLVTSAWHMRRSMLLFEDGEIEVVAAATDHEATTQIGKRRSLLDFLPTDGKFSTNCAFAKEYLGYWVYYWINPRRSKALPGGERGTT